MKDGNFFGEIALMDPNSKRTASVVAIGYCYLFVLTNEDLSAIFKSFPHEQKIFTRVASARKEKDKLRQYIEKYFVFVSAHGDLVKDILEAFVLLDPWEIDGQKIISQAYKASALYYIAKGEVVLRDAATAQAKNAESVIQTSTAVTSLGPGDFFGRLQIVSFLKSVKCIAFAYLRLSFSIGNIAECNHKYEAALRHTKPDDAIIFVLTEERYQELLIKYNAKDATALIEQFIFINRTKDTYPKSRISLSRLSIKGHTTVEPIADETE